MIVRPAASHSVYLCRVCDTRLRALFPDGPAFMLPGRPLRNALCGVYRYCRGVDGVEAQRRWRLKSGCVSPADMNLYA